MKKTIKLFTLIFLMATMLIPLLAVQSFAYAEDTEYHMIKSDNVAFFTEDKKELFILPKSYFLKSRGGDNNNGYYRVYYKDIEGLVKMEDVTEPKKMNIENPYYTVNIQNKDTKENVYIYDSVNSNKNDLQGLDKYSNDTDRNLTFYGTKKDAQSELWYYIEFTKDGTKQKGYILATDTKQPNLVESIPTHPAAKSFYGIQKTPNVTAEKPQESLISTLKILLILGISVPAVIVVFLLFRGGGKKSRPPKYNRSYRRDYYDNYEDDYYDDYRDYDYRDYRRRR